MSLLSTTSCFPSRATSPYSINASRRFDFFIVGAAASTFSSEPNCTSRAAAVFGPMPGMPGTLSLASPTSARKSTTCAGSTPLNLCRTAAASSMSFLRSSKTVTLVEPIGTPLHVPPPDGVTSWSRSLSEDTTQTLETPSVRARATAVAMRSSASVPYWERVGTPKHSAASRMRPICSLSASGIATRFSLYCRSSCMRFVGAPSSNTQSMRYPGKTSRSLHILLQNPSTACAGSFLLDTSRGRAWYILYARLCVSIMHSPWSCVSEDIEASADARRTAFGRAKRVRRAREKA
mmetsp:Transcript_12938/g.42348  ORF Transcript_12938/g.42348 Transcript_12938/m.42348 type:complete len:292 (-) Transcript_12938:62-937(-)